MPASEITAISVVPPPISTTMLPPGSVIGRPAPYWIDRRYSLRVRNLVTGVLVGRHSELIFDPVPKITRAVRFAGCRAQWVGGLPCCGVSCCQLRRDHGGPDPQPRKFQKSAPFH